MKYSLGSIKTAFTEPRKLAIELNRYVGNGLAYATGDCSNEQGVEILDEDWDNLVILDACRFDTFRDVGEGLPGELEKRESKAGATTEFLRHSFQSRDLRDTIYVTANPQLHRKREKINASFFKEYHVWKDNWAENVRTVKPEIVTERTLEIAEQYPDKRVISHYIQPHAPYIGPTSKELPSKYLNFWSSYVAGRFDIDLETAKQAYRENVEIVIPHVERLLNELPGKTVVTADHGELLGERDSPIPVRRYGHFPYTYISELVEVPWLTYQNGDRKNIKAEDESPKQTDTDVSEEIVKERLKDLGYA